MTAPAAGQAPRPGLADYGLLVLLAAFWGGSFMFIKLAVAEVPPATLTMLRLALAAAILAVVALARRERLDRRPRTLALVVLIGFFGNALPFTLISWGEEVVDAGLASILMGIMPIATLLLAHVLTADESLTARKLAGVGIGFAGLVVLVGPAVLLRLGEDGIRQLAILGAAVSYGISAILTKWMLGRPQRAAAAAFLGAAAVIMVPIAFLLEDPMAIRPGWASIASIVYLAVFATALAALMVFVLIGRQGAGFFGQANLLVPPLGVAWAAIFLGERPDASAYVALGFILAGILLARGGFGIRPAAGAPAAQPDATGTTRRTEHI